MKFVIAFILGLFVFAANGEISSVAKDESEFQHQLFEAVSKSSDSFSSIITLPFNTAHKQLHMLLNKTYGRINVTYHGSIKKFNSMTSDIEKQINLLKKKDPKTAECAKKEESHYNSVKSSTHNLLNECVTKSVHELDEHEKEHIDILVEINERVEEFRLVSISCINLDPISTTECVFHKMTEYTKIIKNVGNSYYAAIKKATQHSIIGTKHINHCLNEVIKKNLVKANEVSQNLTKC